MVCFSFFLDRSYWAQRAADPLVVGVPFSDPLLSSTLGVIQMVVGVVHVVLWHQDPSLLVSPPCCELALHLVVFALKLQINGPLGDLCNKCSTTNHSVTSYVCVLKSVFNNFLNCILI